jgi:hypothetical protein
MSGSQLSPHDGNERVVKLFTPVDRYPCSCQAHSVSSTEHVLYLRECPHGGNERIVELFGSVHHY